MYLYQVYIFVTLSVIPKCLTTLNIVQQKKSTRTTGTQNFIS